MRVSDERLRWLAARPATLSIAEALAMIDGVPEAAAELLRARKVVEAARRHERSTTLGAESEARNEMYAALAAYDAGDTP